MIFIVTYFSIIWLSLTKMWLELQNKTISKLTFIFNTIIVYNKSTHFVSEKCDPLCKRRVSVSIKKKYMESYSTIREMCTILIDVPKRQKVHTFNMKSIYFYYMYIKCLSIQNLNGYDYIRTLIDSFFYYSKNRVVFGLPNVRARTGSGQKAQACRI